MVARCHIFVPYIFGLDHRPIPYQYENIARGLDPTDFEITCLAEQYSDRLELPHLSDIRLPPPNSLRRKIRMLATSLRTYDVLQTGGSPVARYFLSKAVKTRNPNVRHIHTVHLDISDEETRRRRFKRRLAAAADDVVAVSEHTAETVKQQFGVTATVVYNAVDVDFFHPDRSPPDVAAIPDSTAPMFLFVGHLEPRKRPTDVIEVARRLPETTFLIRGSGPLSSSVQDSAVKLDNLILLDRLPKATLADLHANVTALLFPSVREGCPTVVLEALASGTPVVGYEATSMPELVTDGETGYLETPGDVEGLTGAVRRLSDTGLAEKLGTTAREYAVMNHRFERVAAQYRDLYLGSSEARTDE